MSVCLSVWLVVCTFVLIMLVGFGFLWGGLSCLPIIASLSLEHELLHKDLGS